MCKEGMVGAGHVPALANKIHPSARLTQGKKWVESKF